MKRYFRNEEATKETIDSRGWLHSGDIGTILPQGKLKIIDRKKNIFKLAQGEYIAPEKIEAFIEQSPYIQQCVVEGHSQKSSPVIIIVPDFEYLQKQKYVPEGTNNKATVEHADVIKLVDEEMKRMCKEFKLKTFEIPSQIYLSEVDLNVENDMLTPTFKKKRHQIRV